MTAFSCPDCEDGSLEAKVREVPLEDGEVAHVVAGVVIITRLGCDGCEPEAEAEPEGDPPPDVNTRTIAGMRETLEPTQLPQCPKSELCSSGARHRGRCNTKLAELVEA